MTEATDLQLAQTTDETVTDEAATEQSQVPAEGQQAAEAEATQEVPVSRPAAGQTAIIEAAPGARYVIAFDANEAQVQIDGNDFILLFEDGARIVFAGLVLLASGEQAPSLLVGGTTIGGDLIVAQAQSLAGQQATLETAAGNQAGQPTGSGANRYSDDLGSLIDPLEAQPDIPYVERDFGLIDLEPITPTPLEEPGEPVIPSISALPSFGTVSEQFLPPRSPSGSQFDPTSGPGSSSDPNAPNVAFSGTLVFDQSNAGVITSLELSDGTVIAPLGTGGASVTVTYAGFSFGPIVAEEGDFLFTTPLGNVLFVDHETGEYLYVLADNEAQSGVGLSGSDDTVVEEFSYTATNSFEQTATATLTIEIEDDAPTAVDEATLKVYENGTVDGPDSVLANDTEGADGTETVASIGVTGDAADQVAIGGAPVSIVGTYGTLTIDQLGVYSYSANDLGDPAPADPIDSFVYTIIDQDGDSAQATITIIVKEGPTGGLAVADGQAGNYVPEDVPTDLTLTANTGGTPLDPNDVLTEIVVDFGRPIDLNGSDPTDQWQLDPADLAAILLLPEVTGVTLADGGSVLTITLNGTTQTFSADLTMTTPDDSDVDLDGVIVTVTAEDTVFGSTGTGSTSNDIIADAVVDGSEVYLDGAIIDTGNDAVGTTVDTPVNLDLTLELGPDSTDQGNGDVSQGDEDGSTLADDTEEVILVTVQVDQGATLAASTAPTSAVDQGGGVTLYSFDTTGLGETAVDSLVASFTVTPASGVLEDINVVIETTTREFNTPPATTLPASGDEANIADNVDVDSYALTIKIVETPGGKLEVTDTLKAYIPEDVPTDVTLSATVGNPADPNEVLTEIVVDFGRPIDLNGSDPETQWQLEQADLDAILALPEVTGVTLADGGSVLTISLNGTTQTFSADLTMTTPDDSDVDLDGVVVTVTAEHAELGTTATGSSTSDIIADAIVDGSEVFRNGGIINSSNNTVGTNLNAAVLLGLTLELGPDSTDQGDGGDVSQGDEDGSTLGDDTEEVILVTVQVDQGATLDASIAPTSTTDLGGGVTLYSFNTTGLGETAVNSLVASFEITPATDATDDISVTIETTTREFNTPPATTLPASGDEADIADNVDVDSYLLTVKIVKDPSGKLAAASSTDGYIPEDTETPVTLSATVADPLDSNEVLTQIVVDFGLPIDTNGSDPVTQWQLDPASLADILALPGVTGVTLADGGSVLTITLNGTTQTFAADLLLTPPLDSDVDLNDVEVTVTAEDTALGITAEGSTLNDVTVDAIVDGTEIVVTAAPAGLQNQFVAIDLNTELHFGEDGTNVNTSTDPSQAGEANTDGSTADDLTEFVSSILVELTDKDSGTPTGTLEFDSPLPAGITVTEDAVNHTWSFEIETSVSRADVEDLVESFSVKPVFNYSGTLEVQITTTTEELNTPPGSSLPASGEEANVADNIDVDSYSIDVEVEPITVHKQVEVSGGEPKPFNICFIIDRSGSMDTQVSGSGGQTRFEIAEAAFRTLIEDIRAQGIDVANVRIVGFNTGTLDVTDFTSLPTEDQLDDFFDDLGNPNGGTRYEPPLQSAAQFLSSINDSNPDVEYDNRILFLSDGGNNNSAGGFLLGTSNGNDNAGAYDDLAKLYGNVGDVGTDIPNLTIKSVGFGISKSFEGDAQAGIPGNTPVNAYLALDQSDDNMVNGSAIVSNANNGDDLADSFGSVVDPSLVIGTLFEGHTLVGDGGLNSVAHLAREYTLGVGVDNADRDAAAAGDVVANDGGVVTIKTENGGFLTVWFVDDGGNLEGDFRYEGPPNYPGERTDSITYVVQDDVGLQLGQLDVVISGQAPANGDFENGNLVDWDYLGSVYVEDNADLSSSNVDGDDFVAVLATNNANGLLPRDVITRADEGVVDDDTLEDGNMTPVEDLGKEPELDDLDLYEQSDLETFLASNGAGANAVDLSTLAGGSDLLDGAVIQTSFELDPLFGTPDGNQGLSITFDWNFATDEGAGGENDIAFVVVEGQLFLLGSVDGSTFSGGALDVGESEITYDRSTGWQTTTLTLNDPDGFTDVDGDNVIHVAFGVADGGVSIGENSALLIDNVQADVS